MTNSSLALQAVELKKSFGATQALRGATLGLAVGEVHALLGENGSGKSTFSKILAGIYPADSGTIFRNGQAVAFVDPAAARAGGVGIVFQELSLAPDLTVADNMFLGRERSAGFLGWVDRKAQWTVCAAMLQRLGLDVRPDTPVRQLRMAQKQLLEIGKALLDEPDILIFDEPTASLTQHEIDVLFKSIEELRKSGKAVLYVTHHLKEVLRVAGRVSVMREGRVVAERLIDGEVTEEGLVGLLTEKRLRHGQRVSGGRKAPLLRVENLKTANCRDVALSIWVGEIVGIYGVVGCGREDVGRSLVGLRSHQGKVELDGNILRASNPCDALAQGIAFLPADRKQEGILPNRSIRENLTLSSLPRLQHGLFLSDSRERRTTSELLAQLRVKYASSESWITTLSGGNQQKVLLGRALATEPRLLILEDPTAGIDIGAKYDLYEQIRERASCGMSFLWISSDLSETLTLCDRVYAMYSGRIVDHLESPSSSDEERLLAAVLGRHGKGAAA